MDDNQTQGNMTPDEVTKLYLATTEHALVELRTRPYHEALALLRELASKLLERGAETEKLRVMEIDLAGEKP